MDGEIPQEGVQTRRRTTVSETIGLIGVDPGFRDRLDVAAGTAVELVRCTVDDLEGDLPQTLVLGPEIDVNNALRLAQQLDSTRGDVGVIIIHEPSPDMLRAALLAGARDVWSPDSQADEIEKSLERLFSAADRRRAYVAKHARATPPGPANTVIVVVSPKGGAGKTMLSTNLGIGIAQRSASPVAIVDLDLRFGDVATALGLSPTHTITDAAPVADNPTVLKTMLTQHQSGLHALCSPLAPVEADLIEPPDTSRIIRTLQQHFGTTIVDTSAGLDEHTLGALDIATDLVLVSTTDIFAINGARKLMDVLEAIDIGEPDRHLVLNRANARVNIARSQIEAILNWRVDVEIPSTRAVPLAMNSGTSLMEAGRVARKPMLQLLDRFLTDEDDVL